MVRRLIMVAVMALLSWAAFASPAAAITNGVFDGNNHPYVGYANNGTSSSCTGALLSPTVMVTAAHCFSTSTSTLGTNSVTGAPLVQVSFDPDLANTDPADLNWYVGSYYWDPQFVQGGGGVPGFDTHDVAVIIFTTDGCTTPTGKVGNYQCGPIPTEATNGQYAALPSIGLVDTLPMNSPVDVVGYGVQNFINGDGPCDTNCKKSRGDLATRYYAATTLVASDNSISDEFLKLHSNDGGACFGDSGGPDLLAGTNTILGLNSFVANSVCTSNTYSYRLDTPEAQQWITTTVAAQGASI